LIHDPVLAAKRSLKASSWGNRRAVIEAFIQDPSFGDYRLFATKANAERVPIATVKEGALSIQEQVFFDDVVAGPGEIVNVLATKRITEQGITELTSGPDASRGQKVGNILRRCLGWTWKTALDAHSQEAATLKL
jgi:hypothetical protein